MLNRFIGACIYSPGIWIIHIVSIENVANRVEFVLFYKYLFFCTVGFFSIGCSQCDSIFSAFWINMFGVLVCTGVAITKIPNQRLCVDRYVCKPYQKRVVHVYNKFEVCNGLNIFQLVVVVIAATCK